MKKLRDKLLKKTVGERSNPANPPSYRSPPPPESMQFGPPLDLSEYVPADLTALAGRATSAFDDTEETLVIPASGWTCATCGWSAKPEYFTISGPLQPRKLSLMNQAAIYGCPRCSLVVQCVGKLGNPSDNSVIEFIHGTFLRNPDWFQIQGDPEPPFQLFHSSYDLRGARTFLVNVMNPMAESTSSLESMSWAKYRLRRCIESHSACRVGTGTFQPARLINVHSTNGNGDVVLEDATSLPPDTEYVALSHCWGKRPITCCTTKGNYLASTTGISWNALPQSFQDAVTVTRGFGVHFLWIDSICIIQDDEDDWKVESSKMFEVYNKALVTLAAVHASDSSGGLFVERSQFHVRLTDIMFENVRRAIFARRIHRPFHSWEPKDLPDKSPLFSRAWAYQERLVSPRTLYFTEREILWECFQETACECRDDDMATSPKQQYRLALQGSGGASEWHRIVSEFSQLDVTRESDRFPAISAIAKDTGQARPSAKYLAGLWSDCLTRDLLWRSKAPSKGRPKAKLAPSWSWVSVLSSVEFLPSGSNALFEIIEAVCSRGDNNDTTIPIYGSQVIKGKLTLRGRILLLEIVGQALALQAVLKHIQTEKELKFFPDCDLLGENDRAGLEVREVCALALASNASHEPRSLSCLVLSRERGESTWYRIGVLISFSIGKRQLELPLESLFREYGVDAIVELE